MRYLGLDLGTRTLGISMSDKTGLIARSYGVIRHQDEPEQLLKELTLIVQKEEVDALVLGYPKNMNNTIGPRAEATLAFQKQLESALHLPVYLMDERLSTKEAEAVLIQGNVRRENRKKVIDAVAAVIILQEFLNKRRKEYGEK